MDILSIKKVKTKVLIIITKTGLGKGLLTPNPPVVLAWSPPSSSLDP